MADAPPAVDKPNVAVFPPFAALGALALAIVLEWVAPLGLLPAPMSWAGATPGAVLIVGAFAMVFAAMRAFKQAATNIDVRKPALVLVESGAYRLSRNPMYLSMIALLAGLGLFFSLDWAIVLAPALWAALHFGAVLREEAYLKAKFGAPYAEFLARTRRWI